MLLTLLQVVCLAAALAGLLFLAGWPTALLVAGLFGMLVCEIVERRRGPAVPPGPRP